MRNILVLTKNRVIRKNSMKSHLLVLLNPDLKNKTDQTIHLMAMIISFQMMRMKSIRLYPIQGSLKIRSLRINIQCVLLCILVWQYMSHV